MDDDRKKWADVCAIGDKTRDELIAAGVDEEFAANIVEVIRHKAGSYLPPVHGVLKIKFDDASLRT